MTGERAPWAAGQTVGKYRLDAHLGRGGMGDVWRAFDVQLGRQVALKRLPPHLSVKPERRERFLREARVLASLRSPSLPVLYAAEGLEDGSETGPFLVLEYVEGQTLGSVLGHGPLGVEEALGLYRKLVRALAVAHAAGVTHRDLKPANVIVRPDGDVVLVDFGIALLRGQEPASRLTHAGTVIGTVAYMAPEQARGELPGPAADVWACGVVLYEMLTGLVPFERDGPLEQLGAIVHDEPEPLESYLPSAPPSVLHLVSRCLEKDPERRPADAAALLALVPVEEVPLAATRAALLAPGVIAEARAHPPLSRRAVAVALGAGLAGIVLTSVASWRAMPPPAKVAIERPSAMLPKAAALDSAGGRPLGERTYVASGVLSLPDGRLGLWVRRSGRSLLTPQRPPGPSSPDPADDESLALFDANGALLFREVRPGPHRAASDPLEAHLSAARAVPPVRSAPGAPSVVRGLPVERLVDAAGTPFAIARAAGQVLWFAREGVDAPAPGSRGTDAAPSLAFLAAIALAGAMAVSQLRGGRADVRGAVALGALKAGLQLLKLVVNPVTLTSGIWLPVLEESLGKGVLTALAYLAFEPPVRQLLPGALAGWTRLSARGRADQHVGREVLAGSAATLPFGALLAAATWLPGRPLGRFWDGLRVFGLEEPGFRVYLQLDLAGKAILFACAVLVLSAGVVRLVRSPHVALALGALAPGLLWLGVREPRPAQLLVLAGFLALCAAVVARGGLVALVTFTTVAGLCLASLSPACGEWTRPAGLLGPALALLLAAGGAWLAFRGTEPGRQDGMPPGSTGEDATTGVRLPTALRRARERV